ncbi:NYN domain-containing protein [Massilia forsythiae]|uniref:NYN domain-containing protein n=1 Tax=Massilia forsythiae TaxID=2728020 RepID=A0A7Z2ZT60_9BURK|nr:NYN domain-containing protein [Massilia forsythiae]QJE01029.1 NYN domain-containing protein [Massilia forsythiae]
MKSALFVDFDNIYSGLRQLDQATADRFASRPTEWMDWVMKSLALPEFATEGARRRVLVRRCYLNPQAYQRFRPYFNKAGFEIIDCPALTTGGKTSTDIHMVLDMMDLLQHEAHYDEFIVFSADADFTPVLRKLRRWDRRTTVLAIGFPSAAYRASADLVIDQDEFVRSALNVQEGGEAASKPERKTTVAVASQPLAPASVPVHDAVPSLPVLDQIMELVRQELDTSREPVPCTKIASAISRNFSTVATDWNGKGTFRRFMESLQLEPLVLDWKSAGGYIVDPARHLAVGKPCDQQAHDEWGNDDQLWLVAKQIHDVTGAPLLSPARYRHLFEEVALDVGSTPFAFIDSGKRIRDRFRQLGRPISRADITFVLRGLLLRGHQFGEGNDAPKELARTFANNVRSLCLREQIMLDQATESIIRHWIEDIA